MNFDLILGMMVYLETILISLGGQGHGHASKFNVTGGKCYQ